MKLKPLVKWNKKGQSILDIILFVALTIVIVIFFGLLMYGSRTLTSTLTSIQTPANSLNISINETMQKSFGYVDSGIQNLKIVGFCLIIGMMLSIIVSAFLVKAHPVFLAGYVMVLILAIILSIVVSMSFSSMMTDPQLNVIFSPDIAGVFILQYLPVWVTIIGLLGAIFLFAGINKDEGMGGSIS